MADRKWEGASNLEAALIPINELVLLPGNPREGDVGAISVSLARFGQQKTITVNDQGVVLAGNHTVQAAQALGWTHIAAAQSELQGGEQNAYALADNRLSDLATYNDQALYDMITDVYEQTGSLEGIGYDDDDLNELAANLAGPLDFNPDDERYTPAWLFEAMEVRFTVDLAAPPGGIPYIPADKYYTKEDDALTKDWSDEFAWCNPPYSNASEFGRKWNTEIAEGVWLGPVSMGTPYRVELMRRAGAIWLLDHLAFNQPNGNTETIQWPVFMAGVGEQGAQAIRRLDERRPDDGLLLICDRVIDGG